MCVLNRMVCWEYQCNTSWLQDSVKEYMLLWRQVYYELWWNIVTVSHIFCQNIFSTRALGVYCRSKSSIFGLTWDGAKSDQWCYGDLDIGLLTWAAFLPWVISSLSGQASICQSCWVMQYTILLLPSSVLIWCPIIPNIKWQKIEMKSVRSIDVHIY